MTGKDYVVKLVEAGWKYREIECATKELAEGRDDISWVSRSLVSRCINGKTADMTSSRYKALLELWTLWEQGAYEDG